MSKNSAKWPPDVLPCSKHSSSVTRYPCYSRQSIETNIFIILVKFTANTKAVTYKRSESINVKAN